MELQQVARAVEVWPAGRAQETRGADLGEARGEDVLEEAGDEDVHRERQAPGLARAGVGVAEGDAAVLKAFDAVVGEGDAVDVAGDVDSLCTSRPSQIIVADAIAAADDDMGWSSEGWTTEQRVVCGSGNSAGSRS